MGAFSQRGWARPSHPHSISLARGRTLALTRSRTLSLPPRTRSQESFFPLTRYLEILKWCHVGCYADRYSFTHRFRVTWVVTQTATRSLIALNPLGSVFWWSRIIFCISLDCSSTPYLAAISGYQQWFCLSLEPHPSRHIARRWINLGLALVQRRSCLSLEPHPSRHIARRWINLGLALVQRRRRWTNVNPTLMLGLVSQQTRDIEPILY